MAMPAPCSAFAVALYPRATRSSQMTISTVPVIRPIAARIAGRNQPCSTEYFRKKIAARTSDTPAIHENSFTPINDSQSNGGLGCFGGGVGGRAGEEELVQRRAESVQRAAANPPRACPARRASS